MERKYLKTCLMFCGGSSFASHGPARPAAGTPTASVYRAARDGTWSPLGRAGALGGLLFAGALPRYALAWAADPAPCRNLVFVGFCSRGFAPASPALCRNLVFGGFCSRGLAPASPSFSVRVFGGALPFDTLHFGLGFFPFANVSLGWSLIDSVNTRPLVGRNSTACP